jgi:hypothetical protein
MKPNGQLTLQLRWQSDRARLARKLFGRVSS